MTRRNATAGNDSTQKVIGLVRPPVYRLAVILLAVMCFGVCACSALVSNQDAGPQIEDDADIPARSQAVTIISFTASPKPAYVGEEVTFWANASTNTGTTLTFTIFFDALLPGSPVPLPNPDSGVSVNVTGNPGSVVQTFTYNSLGNFTYPEDPTASYYYARLWVDDGTYNVSRMFTMIVKLNSPPEFITIPQNAYVDAGEVLNMSVSVMDVDDEPIDVLWEFGDGATATNTTDGTYEDRYVNQTHAWNPEVEQGTGGYTIEYRPNVTISDQLDNNVTLSSTIYVYVPVNRIATISLAASASRIEPGESVSFYANATDPEGDSLTWTFNYSDGTVDVFHTNTTDPGTLVWCNVTHVFEEVGNYTVQMNVSDAIGENQVWPHNTSATVSVVVAENLMPGVVMAINVVPGSIIINATAGYLDVYLSVSAWEPDGEDLIVSWYLDDAADPVVNVSDGGTAWYDFVQIMRLTETRAYNVTVVITDGYPGHEITLHKTLNATSDNMPPTLSDFVFFYEAGEYALPGEEIEFMLIISDREQDVIEVVIDFGDDTPLLHVNLTEFVGRSTTYNFTHSYQYPGVYEITLWFSDNKIGLFQELHTKTITVEVTVEDAFVEKVVIWDWWDYTSLALVFAIPVLVVVRMYFLKRRMARLEREGLTLEEARMKSDEMMLRRLLEGGEGGE